MMKVCRVCYESDEGLSRLIAPCKCKGSSEFIHEHCLRKWQKAVNRREHAFICQICKSYYSKKYLFSLDYACFLYYQYHGRISQSIAMAKRIMWDLLLGLATIAMSLFLYPMKYVLYSLIQWLCRLFSNRELRLTTFIIFEDKWDQKLYFKSASTVPRAHTRMGISSGSMLIVAKSVPPGSIFHKKVVLLLGHNSQHSTGVVFNDQIATIDLSHSNISENTAHRLMEYFADYSSVIAGCRAFESPLLQISMGIGGPANRRTVYVLHTLPPFGNFSFQRILLMGDNSSLFVARCNLDEAVSVVAFLARHHQQVVNDFTSATVVTNDESQNNGNTSGSIRLAQSPSYIERSIERGVERATGQCARWTPHQMQHIIVLFGSVEWERGQLEGELRDGDWVAMPASKACLFTVNRTRLWGALREYYDSSFGHVLF